MNPLHINFLFTLIIFISFFILSGSARPPVQFSGDRFVYTKVKIKNEQGKEVFEEAVEIIGRAKVVRQNRILTAHRIRGIGRGLEKAFAYGNVQVFDTDGSFIVKGGYGEYTRIEKNDSMTTITKNPVFIYKRKSKKQADENYDIVVNGTSFVRHELEKKIIIHGPVRFKKSNEYLFGKAKSAVYWEEKELLELIDDCVIQRGDDLYSANQILYHTNQHLLHLKKNVHLVLYDYNLDPLSQGFQHPWEKKREDEKRDNAASANSGFSLNKTKKQDDSNESPFLLRRYSVLERVKPKHFLDRFSLRNFLHSRIDLYADEIVHDRRQGSLAKIILQGNALWRSVDATAAGGFMIWIDAWGLEAQHKLFMQSFTHGSLSFGEKFRYWQEKNWAILQNDAHIVHLSQDRSPDQLKEMAIKPEELFPIHIIGDELERLFKKRIMNLKGNVRILHGNQILKGQYAVFDEERQHLNFLVLPYLHRNASQFSSSSLEVDMLKQSGLMQGIIQGFFFQDEKVNDLANQNRILKESIRFNHRERVERILYIEQDERYYHFYHR